MNDTNNPFDLLLDSIRVIVREEITAAIGTGKNHESDGLLTAQEVAEFLCRPGKKGIRWVYRAKLPFARHISRKCLRFSEAGLRRWLVVKKPGSR